MHAHHCVSHSPQDCFCGILTAKLLGVARLLGKSQTTVKIEVMLLDTDRRCLKVTLFERNSRDWSISRQPNMVMRDLILHTIKGIIEVSNYVKLRRFKTGVGGIASPHPPYFSRWWHSLHTGIRLSRELSGRRVKMERNRSSS